MTLEQTLTSIHQQQRIIDFAKENAIQYVENLLEIVVGILRAKQGKGSKATISVILNPPQSKLTGILNPKIAKLQFKTQLQTTALETDSAGNNFKHGDFVTLPRSNNAHLQCLCRNQMRS